MKGLLNIYDGICSFSKYFCTLFSNSSKDGLQGSDHDLLYHPHLQPLGLVIQARLRLIICTACQSALLAKSVVRHFSDKHKGLHVQVHEEKILAVAQEWKLADVMPVIQTPVLKFSGLPLITGCVKCPTCQGVYGRGTMPKHYSQHHSSIPTPNFCQLPEIFSQQLNQGQHKTLFEVLVPSAHQDPSTSNTVINHLRNSRDNLVPQYFSKTLDARALSSWIKYTNWHIHVEPYCTSDLIALVAMPQRNEPCLAKLKDAVTAIYDSGYGFIEDCNIIVLQMLKSDDLDGK